jgi:aerobic C4-dicarboxylate transport protein
MDSMRVVVNLLGNCVATFVVSKWEGQFDREAMLRAFRGEEPAVEGTPFRAGNVAVASGASK